MVEEREVFQRQPARAVLIDFSPPMTLDTLINIQQSLSNTLNLLNHISGGHIRVPYISIIVLGNYPEAIFPLQTLKGSTTRLTSALKELGSLARNMVVRQHPSRGCLLEGLQEALAQFNRLTQNYRQGPGSGSLPSQIDITLLTSMTSVTVSTIVRQMTDHLDLQHLKMINAVCVSDPERVTVGESCGAVVSLLDQPSPSELGLSMLELVSIDNDILNLQNMFLGWLRDCGSDNEHLHLSLPPTLQSLTGEEEEESGTLSSQLTLKCDLHERLLDPLLLGGGLGAQFALNRPSGTRGAANTSSQMPSVPVYKLQAMALVAAEGVCESVLLGLPQVLTPTACWKLDWEELETNQQLFTALCQYLTDKNQMLVAKMETTPSPLVPHFLILPSSQSLLVKALAGCELILPLVSPTVLEQPSPTLQQAVARSLGQLECQDTYNPLLCQSGLYETLAQSKRGHPSLRNTVPPTQSGMRSNLSGMRGSVRSSGGTLGTRRSHGRKTLGFQYH